MVKEEENAVVLITGAIDRYAIKKLREISYLKIQYEPDCSREELERLVPSAKVLITRSETKIDAALIDIAKELKVIARAAVGVANIDIEYATKKGILVLNTPGKNTNSAAELTLGIMLALLRKIPQAHHKVKGGGWDRHTFIGNELKGKKIGIVGLGNVGHRVAKFAHGFDMEVFGHDPYIAPEKFARFDVVNLPSLTALASAVDILTVHVPLNRETKSCINQEVISAMKPGSFLINAARGGVIAEKALFAALESGHIAGAAIDTWESEPEILAKLAQHPRVICSPHIGASTEEAQFAIGDSVYVQVLKALEGGVVDYPVNLPQIGVVDNPLVKPYAILAEKLGRLAGQLNKANPNKIEVLYRGDLAGVDPGLIKLGWMKGYVSCAVNSYVSFVNAGAHFESLGLTLEESKDPNFDSYHSAIKFVLHYKSGETLSVGGIVFDQSYIRISLIDRYPFEVEPSGRFIVIRNEDKPGVIGDVGSLLAREQINIDSFELSRSNQGGQALALVKIDSEVNGSMMEKLMSVKHVLSATAVTL
ncbi:MAG: phosphoglycerate dehydrogenase [Oligoflexales bacterium]